MDTGLAEHVLPEVPAMRLEIDEHHQHKDVYQHSLTVLEQAIDLEQAETPGKPDLVLRLAALLHDIGKPATRRFEPGGGVSFHHHEVVGAKMVRKRLRELRYPKDVIEDVATLVYLHLRFHGYGKGEWTDSAVRRYVTDAGPLLPRLHKLVRADCTTRNRRKAQLLQRHLRPTWSSASRCWPSRRTWPRSGPDLDGNAIMRLLGPAAGSAGRPGVALPEGAAAGPRPDGRRRGRGRAVRVGQGAGHHPALRLRRFGRAPRRHTRRARAGRGRSRRARPRTRGRPAG